MAYDTLPGPAVQADGLKFSTSNSKKRGRRWTSQVRIEKRNGLISYCILFTNGHLSATVRGGFSRLPVALDALQLQAFDAAMSWLVHTRPKSNAPKHQAKRLRHVRAHYQPANKHHKEYRQHGRRAA